MHKLWAFVLSIVATCASPLVNSGDFPTRSEQDIQRDATSKPFQVLDFLGVRQGWRVADLFAGRGYYSEVLAQKVGADGRVYLHNNQAYMQGLTDLEARVGKDRLPNVEVYVREVEDVNLPSNSLDMVLMVMAYHDVYFVQNGWTVTADPLFATIKRILKPGGVLGIIDHHAATGTGKAAVQNLHRIEATYAAADIASRGFEFVASAPLLENPADDLSRSVFDDDIRGKTSRFVFKFMKPLE